MPSISKFKDGRFILSVLIWCICHEGQFQVKFASKNKMIDYDSSENDYQMALTIGLFGEFEDALKIHT